MKKIMKNIFRLIVKFLIGVFISLTTMILFGETVYLDSDDDSDFSDSSMPSLLSTDSSTRPEQIVPENPDGGTRGNNYLNNAALNSNTH